MPAAIAPTRSAKCSWCVPTACWNVLFVESYSPEALDRRTLGWIATHLLSLVCLNQEEERMSLTKRYVRDGRNRLIGSVTSGYGDSSSVVRDEHEGMAGRASERFNTVRDAHGNLVSINSSDPGLLIGHRK